MEVAINRIHREPYSQWSKWDQIIYRFPLQQDQANYPLPMQLTQTLARNNVMTVWLVDDADNCVRMRTWRDKKSGWWIHANDVHKFRKLSSDDTEVEIQLQHLKCGVLSAKILTTGLLPLDPFPIPRFYAGSVLPQDVQDELESEYGCRFDETRMEELKEEYLFGEFEQGRLNSARTTISR
ncbi:hypothetical protein PIB30_024139 [Stylosanthes scabra]|uniref:Uncharacterized protein n=1 Tax=Stylosanthes scabra TaxID=79078 RepID=A0ABU6XBG2_9FABA|nr:hypothetical protein [Stylosanthes scabra]